MLNSTSLTSEVTRDGFTVKFWLVDWPDGSSELRSGYWRKGRAVGWLKGNEADVANAARWELVNHLEQLGWERDYDPIANTERWIAPKRCDDSSESFDAYMMRTGQAQELARADMEWAAEQGLDEWQMERLMGIHDDR